MPRRARRGASEVAEPCGVQLQRNQGPNAVDHLQQVPQKQNLCRPQRKRVGLISIRVIIILPKSIIVINDT